MSYTRCLTFYISYSLPCIVIIIKAPLNVGMATGPIWRWKLASYVRSDNNVKSTCKVLSILSPTYIKKMLSTSECSQGYRTCILCVCSYVLCVRVVCDKYGSLRILVHTLVSTHIQSTSSNLHGSHVYIICMYIYTACMYSTCIWVYISEGLILL